MNSTLNNLVKKNIATIYRPNRYRSDFSYSYYAGGETTETIGGFKSHSEVVKAVKAAHKNVNLLRNKTFHSEVAFGYRMARNNKDAYYSRAIEG